MKQLISEIEVSYKPSNHVRNLNPIKSSNYAYDFIKDLFNPELIRAREEFIILYLDNSGRVLGYYKAFIGGVSSVTCDLKIIFGVALKSLSSAIILSHNHPSGNLTPSMVDLKLTKRVNEAAKLLDLKLLDHLIISDEGYCSLADKNLLNDS
ncbi:JAB domain-containing protein [Algoriphagus sp. SE2]|uniref:JAB domain-containing protein n=1 Tax=Algoriphagus sp. SE2 TaxID=3141536 RepID=UPI0031CD7A0F